MSNQSTQRFTEVRKQELEDVIERRDVVFPQTEVRKPNEVASNLVGLALSGGGGRSASFSLGIIQAFYRRGVLKYLDFISSVSGGGYIAGSVSQLISGKEAIDWQSESTAATPECGSAASPPLGSNIKPLQRLPFAADKSGRQPSFVRNLGSKIVTMRRPLEFFSRHLWGLITLNLFVITGIVTVTAALAYLMKMTSGPVLRLYLAELGLRDDISRELAPAVFLLILWVLAIALTGAGTKMSPPFRTITTALCASTLLTFALGIINILGAGDVSLSATERAQIINPNVSNWINSALTLAKAALATLLAASFLPYLKLPALIESGVKSKPSVLERWISSTVSTVVVLGVPLFCYYLVAAENVSGHQSRSSSHVLTQGSVRNWSKFYEYILISAAADDSVDPNPLSGESSFSKIERLASEVPNQLDFKKGGQHSIGAILWKVTAKPITEENPTTLSARGSARKTSSGNSEQLPSAYDASVDSRMQHAFEEIVALDQQIINDDARYWTPQRWLWCVGSLFSRHGTYLELVRRRVRFSALQRNVIAQINSEVLSNPTLYRAIEDIDEKTKSAAQILDGEVTRIASRPFAKKAVGNLAPDLSRPGRWLHQIVPAMAIEMKKEEHDYESLGGAASRSDEKTLLQARIDYFELEQLANRVRKLNLEIIDRALVGDFKKKTSSSKPVAVVPQNTKDSDRAGEALPQVFYPLDHIFGLASFKADQAWRLETAGWSLLLFLCVGLLTNLNHSSMHGFYRDQLGRIWCPSGGDQVLSTLKPWKAGGPIPFWTGTYNRFCRLADGNTNATAMFLFSPRYCGTAGTQYIPTDKYLHNRLTLSEVMAISGAAVSPAVKLPIIFRMFLILTNFRFGQWLPTPSLNSRVPRWAAPLRILCDWQVHEPESRAFAFVSDGGHCENLGIAPLLQRRCRLILAVDSGYDPDSRFLDLSRLLHYCETEYGVRMSDVEAGDMPLSLKNLLPTELKTPAHVLVAKINYPENTSPDGSPSCGYLVYIKPSFTGDESTALKLYRDSQRDFPNDPTIDQFFEPEKFEAYRQLGEHIGESVWRQLWKENCGEEAQTSDLHTWVPSPKTARSEFQRLVLSPVLAMGHLNSPLVSKRRIAARALATALRENPSWIRGLFEESDASAAECELPFSTLAVLDGHLSSETDKDVIRWIKQAISDIEKETMSTTSERPAT